MRRSLMAPISATASGDDVGGKGDRFSMEVAAGDHFARTCSPFGQRGEDERVVRRGVRLDHATRARRACRLSRHAPITCGTQRIEYGSCTRPQCGVRLDDLRCLQAIRARAAATAICPGLAARGVDARIQRLDRALESLPATARPPSSAAHEHALRPRTGRTAPGRWTDLRAVQQRQAFFGARAQTAAKPAAPHRLGAPTPRLRALGRVALTLANQHAAPDAPAARGHPTRRPSPWPESPAARPALNSASSASTMAGRTPECPRARLTALAASTSRTTGAGQRIAHADRCATAPGCAATRPADRGAITVLRQLAKAGVDAVNHLVFLNDALHRGQRGLHASLRRGVERELHATGVDAAQLRQRDVAGIKGDGGWSWCQSCLYK
jgi:hypothetical protein